MPRSLLRPPARHRPCQLLQLHSRRLSPTEIALILCKKGEPQQAGNEAAGAAFRCGLGELGRPTGS
jgi:hypothetical protein